MRQRNNPFIAAALSVVLPGAGQIYNRQKNKAMMWYVIFFMLPVLFVLCKCLHSFWGMLLLLFLYIWLYLYNVGDAIYRAVRPKRVESRPLHKLLIMALMVFIASDVYMIASNRSRNTIGLRAFRMIANSMAPTIKAGDSLILDLNDYKKNQIRRGDIITFRHESYKGLLSKRVIGIPGDSVKGEGNTIFINGEAIKESYAQYIERSQGIDGFNRKPIFSDFGPVVVPDGELFLMGDNRNNSFDSRYPEFGTVPIQSVWAKPLYIYFSKEKSRIGKKIE
jgi:signal peptidase I